MLDTTIFAGCFESNPWCPDSLRLPAAESDGRCKVHPQEAKQLATVNRPKLEYMIIIDYRRQICGLLMIGDPSSNGLEVGFTYFSWYRIGNH